MGHFVNHKHGRTLPIRTKNTAIAKCSFFERFSINLFRNGTVTKKVRYAQIYQPEQLKARKHFANSTFPLLPVRNIIKPMTTE